MEDKLLFKDGKLLVQNENLLKGNVGSGATNWGQIGGDIENQTDLIDLVNSKAILHELIYDGTNIKDTEGNILGFADIKMLLDNPNDYVYINDLTNHCILNYGAYEDDALWFNSRYKIDGTNNLVRLIINDNDQLQYNVDEVPNIDKVLTKPNIAPTSNELVGIGTDNSQKRITIGDNLTLENNVLSASGGGSNEWELISEVVFTDQQHETEGVDYIWDDSGNCISFNILNTIEYKDFKIIGYFKSNNAINIWYNRSRNQVIFSQRGAIPNGGFINIESIYHDSISHRENYGHFETQYVNQSTKMAVNEEANSALFGNIYSSPKNVSFPRFTNLEFNANNTAMYGHIIVFGRK